MSRSSIFGVLLALSCGMSGCAGLSGGGPSHISNDGVWTYTEDGTARSRSDLAFLYFDTGCALAKDDVNAELQYLGDPQKLLDTDEYLGTALYAVAPGTHTVKLHFVAVDGERKIEGSPTKTGNFLARHFYGFDCSRVENGDIHADLIERDHISDKASN